MKVMKKKIIGLLVCMLMLTTIPLATGMTETEKDPEPKEIFDRVLVTGMFFRLNRVGDWYHGQVARIRYYELNPFGDRSGGVCTFPDLVVFKEPIGSFYRIFQFGLGLITFVVGILTNFEIY
ncbi:MAG: hypothetical protein KAQ84_04675 [Thermoplasmatales archaeon]|nr:hypothetical protein [Thermoplasmatales archaeon]MCK5261634.1 hypothetical protein [Thermoplasmatales archaeon]